MGQALDVVERAYAVARRGDRQALRELLADEATWQPARKGAWQPCRDAEDVVQTLVWRAGAANRLRPVEPIEAGEQVVVRLRGRRLDRLGGRGLLVPRLFQLVTVRDGAIVELRDYGRLEDALAATGAEA